MGDSVFGAGDEFIGTDGTGTLDIGGGRSATYGPFDFPSCVMTLLSDDYFFFQDDEIAWDGTSHAIRGIQFNAARQADFEVFRNRYTDFDDVQDAAKYLMGFLNEVEKDDGLRVPCSAIAPALRKAVRQGDLTGLTLANLAACAKALVIGRVEGGYRCDCYTVMYESSLAIGIPAFFTYVLRLIWDLRLCTNSQREKPFACIFVGCRNFDFERAFLSEPVEEVEGACRCPLFIEVAERPGVGVEAAKGFLKDGEGSDDSGSEEVPEQGSGQNSHSSFCPEKASGSKEVINSVFARVIESSGSSFEEVYGKDWRKHYVVEGSEEWLADKKRAAEEHADKGRSADKRACEKQEAAQKRALEEQQAANAAAERARLKKKMDACQHDVNEKRKRCEDARAAAREADAFWRDLSGAYRPWDKRQKQLDDVNQKLTVANEECEQLECDIVRISGSDSFKEKLFYWGDVLLYGSRSELRKALIEKTQRKEEVLKEIEALKAEHDRLASISQPEKRVGPNGELSPLEMRHVKDASYKARLAKEKADMAEKDYQEACQKLERVKVEYRKKTDEDYD